MVGVVGSSPIAPTSFADSKSLEHKAGAIVSLTLLRVVSNFFTGLYMSMVMTPRTTKVVTD